MLTALALLALERALRAEPVLSVYIDGTETNVAERERWRLDLSHSLRELRASLNGSPPEEREAFDHCVARLEGELAVFSGAIGAPGWVTFISATAVHLSETVPVPTPTRAIWATGASIAPYMRVLKEARPAITLIVDARKGRIFRYYAGELTLMKTVHAHASVDPPSHMGNAPRTGFHAGVHGVTGHDAAQRSLLAGTRRMTRELVHHATSLAGTDGWVLVGGIPEVASHVTSIMARLTPERARVLEGLDVHASDSQIATATRQGASALREAADLAIIDEIVEHANGGTRAALGSVSTRRALSEKRVRELYLTHRYREDQPADAETAVRLALARGAQVEEVSRTAAERLDELGGIAARLRYSRQRRRIS
jgi:hypothetical protein